MPKRIRKFAAALSAWDWIPTLCFAVVPALVIRGRWTVVAGDATRLWGDYFLGDIRSWWKAACAVGIALWMLCMAGFRIGSGWRSPSSGRRLGGLVALAAAAVLASTWMSPFPDTRWIGYTALYEGAYLLLACLVALWYAGATESAERRLFVVRAVIVVAAVNIVLGILAGVHRNFWQSEWGAWVIGFPEGMIRHNFAGTNMASGTVYQPNHYGMLMAMTGALALGMLFAEKKPLWKYVWSGVYAFSIVSLLFSRSRAGTMVLGALTLIVVAGTLYRLRKSALSRLRLTGTGFRKAALIAAAALALAAFFAFIGFGDAAKIFLERSTQIFAKLPLNSEITDVALRDNVISVVARSGTVRVGKLSATSWYAEPEGGRRAILQFAERGGWRVATLPGVGRTTLRINQRGNVQLRGPDTGLEFFALGTELFAVDQTKTNLRLRADIPFSTYAPNGWEGFLSARGYIWARTLEKWLERPWFGWGPGALPLAFPNAELLNKQRFSFGQDEDKAHSLPFAFLVQTGVIGTILYFLPFGYAAYVLARSRARLRLPLLLAMAAYLICGLTNDSTNGVTPLFCVFAGLAVAEAKDGEAA